VPTRILGIAAYYHDSAACLLEDGRIVAAAQEERFTRKKHDAACPSRALDYCLREAGITVRELDLVGFYEKPLLKFERLLETYIASAPRGFRSYLMAMPQWLARNCGSPTASVIASTGVDREHLIQCPRPAHRVHARRCRPVFPAHTHGRARPRELHPRALGAGPHAAR